MHPLRRRLRPRANKGRGKTQDRSRAVDCSGQLLGFSSPGQARTRATEGRGPQADGARAGGTGSLGPAGVAAASTPPGTPSPTGSGAHLGVAESWDAPQVPLLTLMPASGLGPALWLLVSPRRQGCSRVLLRSPSPLPRRQHGLSSTPAHEAGDVPTSKPWLSRRRPKELQGRGPSGRCGSPPPCGPGSGS